MVNCNNNALTTFSLITFRLHTQSINPCNSHRHMANGDINAKGNCKFVTAKFCLGKKLSFSFKNYFSFFFNFQDSKICNGEFSLVCHFSLSVSFEHCFSIASHCFVLAEATGVEPVFVTLAGNVIFLI